MSYTHEEHRYADLGEPPEAEFPDTSEYSTVYNVVDDLGWDPTGDDPITGDFVSEVDHNTLLIFPPGRYRWDDWVHLNGYTNFGMAGQGDRGDVEIWIDDLVGLDHSSPRRALALGDCPDLRLHNIDFDQHSADDDRAKFNTRWSGDGLRITDCEIFGYIEPETRDDDNHNVSGQTYLSADDGDVMSFERVIVRGGTQLEWDGSSTYKDSESGAYLGSDSDGTMQFAECEYEQWSDNGLYCSRTGVGIEVSGGYYQNNFVANIRLSNDQSWTDDGCETVLDNSALKWGSAPPGNCRGVRLEDNPSSQRGSPYGVEIRDTLIRFENFDSSHTSGPINMSSDLGGEHWIEGCTFEVSDANQASITAASSFEIEDPPHRFNIDDCFFTGENAGGWTISTQAMEDVITDSVIYYADGTRDGVTGGSGGSHVENSTVDVPGDPIGDNVTTENVSFTYEAPVGAVTMEAGGVLDASPPIEEYKPPPIDEVDFELAEYEPPDTKSVDFGFETVVRLLPPEFAELSGSGTVLADGTVWKTGSVEMEASGSAETEVTTIRTLHRSAELDGIGDVFALEDFPGRQEQGFGASQAGDTRFGEEAEPRVTASVGGEGTVDADGVLHGTWFTRLRGVGLVEVEAFVSPSVFAESELEGEGDLELTYELDIVSRKTSRGFGSHKWGEERFGRGNVGIGTLEGAGEADLSTAIQWTRSVTMEGGGSVVAELVELAGPGRWGFGEAQWGERQWGWIPHTYSFPDGATVTAEGTDPMIVSVQNAILDGVSAEIIVETPDPVVEAYALREPESFVEDVLVDSERTADVSRLPMSYVDDLTTAAGLWELREVEAYIEPVSSESSASHHIGREAASMVRNVYADVRGGLVVELDRHVENYVRQIDSRSDAGFPNWTFDGNQVPGVIDETRMWDEMVLTFRVHIDTLRDVVRPMLDRSGEVDVIERIDGGFSAIDRSEGASRVDGVKPPFGREDVRSVRTFFVDDYEEEPAHGAAEWWEVELELIPDSEKAYDNVWGTLDEPIEEEPEDDKWHFDFVWGDVVTRRVSADIDRAPKGTFAGAELEMAFEEDEVRTLEESVSKLAAINYREVPDGRDVLEDQSPGKRNTVHITPPEGGEDTIEPGEYIVEQWEVYWNQTVYNVVLEVTQVA